jgi:hypothetical protein
MTKLVVQTFVRAALIAFAITLLYAFINHAPF